MATNKTKRSIHLTQPQPQPAAKLMPVRAYVYRAIAELNAGFELTLQELKRLEQVDFLPSAHLLAMHTAVGELRTQANREFLAIIGARETANAAHFERLHSHGENKPPEPPSAS